MGSGDTIPVLKEELIQTILGHRALTILVFVVEVTEVFTLGLDALRANEVSV
jgi:hypothetical protein